VWGACGTDSVDPDVSILAEAAALVEIFKESTLGWDNWIARLVAGDIYLVAGTSRAHTID
jgi:hypothetical protein